MVTLINFMPSLKFFTERLFNNSHMNLYHWGISDKAEAMV